MCYTLEISRNALFINLTTSIILFTIGKKSSRTDLQAVALFFLFVGQMQLWDWMFWKYPVNSSQNKLVTKVATVWNHLEPVVLAVLIALIMKTRLNPVSKALIIIYSVVILIYTTLGWKSLSGTGRTAQSADSLDWRWNHFKWAGPVYALFLITLAVLFYQNFTGWVKWLSVILVIGSFFFSYYKYQVKLSTGRFWCYFAAFAPLIYIVTHFIMSK